MDENTVPLSFFTYVGLLKLSQNLSHEEAISVAREHYKLQHGAYPEDHKPDFYGFFSMKKE